VVDLQIGEPVRDDVSQIDVAVFERKIGRMGMAANQDLVWW